MRTTMGCTTTGIPGLTGIWKGGQRFLSCLTTLTVLAAALFFTTYSYAQGNCASSNCTAGDMRITKVELLKSDGTALPNVCDVGQPNIQVMLRVTFDVTSST